MWSSSRIGRSRRTIPRSISKASACSDAARGPGEPGGDSSFMHSGTSSAQLWSHRTNAILPTTGLTPDGTQIGVSNPQKIFDAASLDTALPYFQKQQYQTLFAREYTVDAATITG